MTYVQGFAQRFRAVNVLSFDAYTWFEDILADAAQYGFTNTTGCVCRMLSLRPVLIAACASYVLFQVLRVQRPLLLLVR